MHPEVEAPLGMRSAAVSERGRRAVNEDAVLIAALADGRELVAVADGMGGHAAGDIASRRALETLHAEAAAGATLEAAVRAANVAVFEEASRHADRHGMGSTIVALVRRGGRYDVANVGDSRAYRIDGRGVVQLTNDHSFVAEAVRSGQLSAEEAERSRWRNAVTRAVGTERELEVDCFGPFDATDPHTVLLCTDGLYRSLGESQLRELVLRDRDPALVVERLIYAAYQAGADDNISVAMIRFGAAPEGAALSDGAPAGRAPVDGAAPPEGTPAGSATVDGAAPPDDAPAGSATVDGAAPPGPARPAAPALPVEPTRTFTSAGPLLAPSPPRAGRRRRPKHGGILTARRLLLIVLAAVAVTAYIALLRLLL
jgi:PPM family protein phosphatase